MAEAADTADTADRVVVAFDGDGAGIGELSWGQLAILDDINRLEDFFTIGGVTPLPSWATVDDIAGALRYMMSRYQSLRTLLRVEADGRVRQEVVGSGEIALEVVDVSGGDPEQVAARLAERYRVAPFDHTREWPVRTAVIRSGGVCTHQVMMVSHFALDGAGAAVMVREVLAPGAVAATGTQPMEQARWQASPAGRRQNDASLRYWENLLRTMPLPVLGPSTDVRRPRYWHGALRSPALRLAVRALENSLRQHSAPILLAAYAVAFAQVTGVHPVPVRPLVGNRFRPGLAEAVCPLTQIGLCVFGVVGVPFGEAVERVRRGSMTAYKYGYYNRADLNEMIARVVAARGPEIDFDAGFNDRRAAPRPLETDPVPEPREIADALPATTFAWTNTQDRPSATLMVHIDDDADAIRLMINVDSRFLSPDLGAEVLRAMETVVVQAAFDGARAPSGG
jgi:hypothetical protein